jgi:DNA-directed RNA polymerase subunit RPC12/RpoP
MDQQQIMKHLKDSTGIKCEKCEHQVFTESYIIRKISKILVGAVSDVVVPVPIFSCASCGHINDDFKPNEFSLNANTGKISNEG